MISRQTPLLKVQGSPRAFPLGENYYSLGRSQERDLILPEMTVSRYHCLLYRGLKQQPYTVCDGDGQTFCSMTGTWVNHHRLDFPWILSHGDLLQIGSVELLYLEADEDSEPDPFDTLSPP